jgi:hypothetical protein
MKSNGAHLSFPKQRWSALIYCLLSGLICATLILSAGCATVGRDFPVDQVKMIKIGETTKKEIRNMFGEPWRVGLEDGLETWSYGKYHYSMFSEKDAKDLVVRFTDKDVVESYTFNTTNQGMIP